MIEQTLSTQTNQLTPNTHVAKPKRVFSMTTNERMAGSVPQWSAPQTAKDEINANLGSINQNPATNALAYNGLPPQPEEEFGFADLIDMVNPLHHIPLVGQAYREITGDTIKPSANIIGGAVFGGPLGAAAGIANAVIAEETGKTMEGNAKAFIMHGEAPSITSNGIPQSVEIAAHEEIITWNEPPATTAAIPAPSVPAQKHAAPPAEELLAFNDTKIQNPEQRLDAAITEQKAYEDLPIALLSFADIGHQSGFKVEKVKNVESRTAGTMFTREVPIPKSEAPIREPITQVHLTRRYND